MKMSHLYRLLTLVLIGTLLFAALPTGSARAAASQPAHLSAQGWLLTSNLDAPQPPSVTVQSSDATRIVLSALPGSVQVERTKANDTEYTTIGAEGFGHGAVYGQPDLPVVRRSVEIPFGAKVSLEVTGAEYEEINLKELGYPAILPLQLPTPKSRPAPEFTGPDAAVYTKDAFFPASPVQLGSEYTIRGHRAQTVDFAAVAYNPVSGILRVYKTIQVRLNLSGSDMTLTLRNSDRFASPVFETYLADTLLNFNQGKKAHSFTEGKDAVGYLIVTADSYYTAIQPFVALKESQGFTVTTVKTSVTGTTNTAIKTYIANAYNTWPVPPSYVLLVGDAANSGDSIPGWSSTAAGEITDLYYGTMDGSSDWTPDIFRGRFPVRSVAQATIMVNNAIAYDNVTGAEPWVKKVALLATDDGGNYDTAEGTQNYVASTYTIPLGYTGIFPNPAQPGGDKLYAITYNAENADVIESVNDERSMVIYTGHGSNYSWAGPSVSQTDVRNLTSDGVLSYVAGHACITTDFELPECFAETWVLQNNKGAIVYYGSSDSSYWDEDDILERRYIDYLYTSTVEPSVGAFADYGQSHVTSSFPSSARYYWETYNIMGDPSTYVVLGPKSPDFTLAVDPAAAGICNAGTVTSTVTTGSINDYADPVNLSALGLPAGVTAEFATNPVSTPGSSVLTLTNDGTAAAGLHALTVQGTAGDLTHAADLELGIFTTNPGLPTLLTPENNSNEVAARPTFTWTAAVQGATYDLEVATNPGFTSPVISVTGISDTSYTPAADLQTGTVYFWRLRANNPCGQGEFTAASRFTTVVLPGDCPPGATLQTLYSIDFEGDTSAWTHSGTGDTWAVGTTRAHSPAKSFHAADAAAVSDQSLVSPAVTLPSVDQGPLTLSFWNHQTFENSTSGCYDGAILEVSTNGGSTWTQVDNAKLLTDPYDFTIGSSYGNPLAGKQAWCGNVQDWTRSVVNLNSYAGQSVQFRFRVGSDSSVSKEGWYIDDVLVKSCVNGTYGVTATPETQSGNVKAGETIHYTVSITNTGSAADTFSVQLSGVWNSAVVTSTPVALGAGESADVDITVTAPLMAVVGSSDVVTVTVTSLGDASASPASASATLTTTVNEGWNWLFMPVIVR